MRVFAPKGRVPEAKFAEGMAPYCVKYFEEKIKINYTLPKLGKSKWCIVKVVYKYWLINLG